MKSSDLGSMNEICLLIENSDEQELIKEILGNSYLITIADSPANQICDLFISSSSMFDRHKEILRKIKKDSDPIFAPVLLVTFKSDINLMVSDLHEVIDEVITAPLTASKLIPGIQILLRMRSQSLQLQKLHSECIKREEDLRITQHQLAEERNFSDAIINTQGALVAVLNDKAEIVRFNRACERTMGYAFEEVKGHSFWDFFAEDELDNVKKQYNSNVCGKASEYENYIISKSGQKREINWRNTLICNDRVEFIIATGVDITDRKVTERKLQESETRLQIAQQAAKIGTFEYNIQTDVNIWTPELEAIHGLSPGQFGKDLISWESLVHPEDRAMAWERVNLAYQSGEPVSGEWRVIWPDGSIHWIHAGFQAFYDSSGKPSRLIGVNIDITAGKENERQVLRKNKILLYVKEILAEAVQTESDEQLGDRCLQLALSLTSSEYGFIGEIGSDGYLHDIAISGMGWDVCAMYDKSGHRRPPGNFAIHGLYGRVLDFNKSFFTNEPSVHPDHIGLPGGHPPLLNFLGVPFIHQGKTVGMIAMANKAGGYSTEDVEDLEALVPSIMESLLRKRAERALHESEAKFRRIFDSNLLAIAFWRSDGQITDANQALCDILGCTREEVLAGKVNWKDQTPPEILWRDQQAIDEVNERGVSTPYQKTIIHLDGHRVPVLVGGASIGAKDQGVTYIIDLTEQKEYEKSLKEAQRVAELHAREAEEGKRMLDALMENVPEGISISDTDGKIHMISKHGQNLLGGIHPGMSIEEAVRNWTVLLPDGKTVMPIEELPLVRALRGETVRNIEILEMNSEGRLLPLLCNAAPIRADGKVVDGIIVWRDITEIKKAEQALRESKWNLEEAQKISHVGSWIWSVETGELSCSAETFRIYGEEPFSFQPTINIFFNYVYPEDCVYIKDIIADLKAGRTKRIDKEFRIVRKDRSIRYIHSIGEVLEYSTAGKPHLITGIGQDITESKEAEKALKASEERLRLIMQVAQIGSFEYDMVNNISKWSPEMETLHGLNPGEYSGNFKQWKAFVYQDDLTNVEHILGKAMETGLFQTEWRIVRTDGAIRWMAARGQVFRDNAGNPVRMMGVNIDITERKQAEDDLKFEQERLQIILDNMNTGVILLDNKGHFLTFNKAVLEWFGYTTESEMWKYPSDYITEFELRDSEDNLIPFERWPAPRAVNGEYVKNYEVKITRKQSDKSRWISITTIPILGLHREVVSILMSMVDITERKHAEEALQRYADELSAANHDLESFSYSVSHDLRNPLGLIGGFAGFLIEDYSEKLDEEGRDYLRRIDDGVKKMKSLIEDMLSLSRIGRQEMNRADVDLSATVRNYLAELKISEPDRQVQCSVEENVHVNADPRLIHLALENLLRNAWKFTAKNENARIEFGTMVIDKQTVYFIRDNGIGFDVQFAKKIFEPFKRVHKEKEFGGTGVGLSIVQRVVERHGGRVWAEGEKGKGATFYFTLG